MDTCCLGQDSAGNPTGKCVAHGQACPASTVSFSCGGASDCPSGEICCGKADDVAQTAGTSCTSTCPTTSPTPTQGQAQVCKGNAECQNQMKCVAQVCLGKANLNLCGLTPQSPFDCKAR